MKLLFLLLVVTAIGVFVYFATSVFLPKNKKKKGFLLTPVGATAFVVIALLCLIALGMYKSAHAPDMQCGKVHKTTLLYPAKQETAEDYFNIGNFEYDRGNCQAAVDAYTKAIQLNPNYAQAYNNRGYTYMRMRNYKAALPDFDKAISMRGDYVNALMNRGDLYNYYGPTINRQKAIEDYNKAISLGANQRETSVCGHKMLAENGGWSPIIILKMILSGGPNATC